MDSSLSRIETERILSYFDKLRNMEILFCIDHDREFPFDEKCPICEEDERLFLDEMKWRKEAAATKILSNSYVCQN